MYKRILILAFAVLSLSGMAQTASRGPWCKPVDYPAGKPTCSLTGVNPDCVLMIDRMHPAAPPVIYMKRGATVSVKVINLSPFEKLTLDLGSIQSQAPVDNFQAQGSALLTQLGSFVLLLPQAGVNRMNAIPGEVGGRAVTIAGIEDDQADLGRKIQALTHLKERTVEGLADAFAKIKMMSEPPSPDACSTGSEWYQARSAPQAIASELESAEKALHKPMPENGICGGNTIGTNDVCAAEADMQKIQKAIDSLAPKPSAAEAGSTLAGTDQTALDRLKTNQDKLKKALESAEQTIANVFIPAQKKLEALRKVVEEMHAQPLEPLELTIPDVLRGDRNDQVESFTLNAGNLLTGPISRLGASAASDSYTQALSDADLKTAAAKTSIETFKVQFVTQPRMEISSGVMVPLMPIHSYSVVTSSADASKTIIQKNQVWTIVPVANMNFRLGDDQFWLHRRVGFFATGTIGYNPSSETAETGGGFSVSCNTFQLSLMADVGRDTRLTNGAAVGDESSTPNTHTVWQVKPAIGITIRLPFGK